MNSYEIMRAANRLVFQLEDSGGVISDESLDSLREICDLSEDKLGAILAVRDRLKMEEAQHKELVARHTSRRKSLERGLKRLNRYAEGLLEAKSELDGSSKASGPWGSCWVTTRKELEIPDETAIGAAFWTEKITRSIDKKLIKKALATAPVQGATLTERRSITWRVK